MNDNLLSKIVRILVRTISIVGGIFGLFQLYIGIVSLKSNSDFAAIAIFICVWGGLLILNAYLLIRNFTERSIKLFSFLLIISLFSWIAQWMRPLLELYIKEEKIFEVLFITLIYIFIPFIMFFVCKNLLLKVTGIQHNPNHSLEQTGTTCGLKRIG